MNSAAPAVVWKASRKVPSSILWVGILATLALAIFSDSVVQLFNLEQKYVDLFEKSFTGLNAVLLSLLSGIMFIGSYREAVPFVSVPAGIGDSEADGFQDPNKVIVVVDDFPSFADTLEIRKTLRRAALLATFQPKFVSNIQQAGELLKLGNVIAVAADEKFYNELLTVVRKSEAMLFCFSPSRELSVSGGGKRTNIGVPERDIGVRAMHEISKAMTAAFSLDTPRSVGFQGNWVGTYGLMTMQQNSDMRVTGKYWYGQGEFTGRCEVDEDNERLIFRFRWTQESNKSGFASTNSGRGVFVLPAGYEIILGCWYVGEDPKSSQTWCGCRLAGDIERDLLRGGEYAKCFGLEQHSLKNLIEH